MPNALPPLVDAGDVATELSDFATFSGTRQLDLSGPDYLDVLPVALDIVSAAVRSYTGSNITISHYKVYELGDPGASATYLGPRTFQGTRAPRLVLGERPITDVWSVTLDDTELPASEYRWTRNGSLWRTGGWSDASREVVVEFEAGYERCPDDLRAVVMTAVLRVLDNPTSDLRVEVEGYSVLKQPGWTVGDLLVLKRYRRTQCPAA